MAQQTAVEWLEYVYNTQGRILPAQFEQAKQMEREQIVKAHDDGDVWSGEKYYTKTYGK